MNICFRQITLDSCLHFSSEQCPHPLAQDSNSLDFQVVNPPESAGDIGDMSSIPGLGRPLAVRNGNALQYSCLENSMDRGTQQVSVHEVPKN